MNTNIGVFKISLLKLIPPLLFIPALIVIFPHICHAQTQIKPYMLIIFDTSGSMAWDVSGNNTRGDGTNDPWGSRRCCPGIDRNGNGLPDDSRMYQSKQAIYQVVSSTGDITFGLMKFPQYFVPGHRLMYWYRYNQNPTSRDYLRYNGECSSSNLTDYLVVEFSEESSNEVLMWMDNREYSDAWTPISSTERELRADGPTPLAWTVDRARDYYASSVIPGDPYRECRPYFTVVLSDGEETCGGNPGASVRNLYTITFGGNTYHVITYVIGYATSNANLDAMADYGDDGVRNYSRSAYRADSTDELAIIFSEIIRGSVLVEVCDGIDNDCDTLVDEGFTLYCNRPAGHPSQDLCDDPGETVCDGIDDNCNGTVDEGLLNACGTCGPTPEEVCDGIDNDCDTIVDNWPVCAGCTPQPEVCNGIDDDCDGRVDEDISTSCGTDVGQCTTGVKNCIEQSPPGDGVGHWGPCSGVAPSEELCDGIDNDCDGIVDGFSELCEMAPGVGEVGECTYGYRICTDGSWSECQGGIGPREEVCDGLDNDCDGVIDDGNPGGGGRCGTNQGECVEGTLVCEGGILLCEGGIGPTPELCDGLDNDCDGSIDNGNPEGGAPCGPTELDGIGICRAGMLTCVTEGYGSASLQCIGAVEPRVEECNCLDDDCDTVVDEELSTGAPCGITDVGECEYGQLECDPTVCDWVCVGEIAPVPETCNGLDDNCDGTIDEGNPEGGGPCGESEGECEPGILWCSSSDTPPPCEPPEPLPEEPTLLCLCGKGPTEEVCDGLDNNCNGEIDEGLGLGEECGLSEGECEPGRYMCVDGEVVCVGGRFPQLEVCDCLDNDCDGDIDEDDPCEGDAICYHESANVCYCAEPCDPSVEWGCVDLSQVCQWIEEHEGYYCVGDPCEGVECDEGQVCRYGQCISVCEGVTCPEGQVCVAVGDVGVCVPANCYIDDPQYRCEEGQICKNGRCVDDPCWEVECGPGQFCRDGQCHDVCTTEDASSCEEGQKCYDGECIPDPCYGLNCPPQMVCNEQTGQCEDDPCIGVDCFYPLVCIDGKCVDPPCSFVECPEGYQCIDDTCISSEAVEEEQEPIPEATDQDGGIDAEVSPSESWDILPTGGGGCAACSINHTEAAGAQEASLSLIFIISVFISLTFLIKRKNW